MVWQATGQWERAIEIADKRDRIHLKATQYNWGKHLVSPLPPRETLPHFGKLYLHTFIS